MTTTRTDTEVYQDHAVELTRYATVLVGPDDAPDIVTDAVLDAFAAPNWRNVEHRRAYLFRSVLNHANSFHRSTSRRRRRDHLAVVRAPSTAFDPEPSVDAQHALRTLSPQQRAVIYLSYWEDQTASDIAALLDISEGSVRKQLARARVQLRRVMAS
jgi:RNA polymerase sigma factor (sigma-70 family)